MKIIICIHAHSSNIPYLTQLFQDKDNVILEHYVMTDFFEIITKERLTQFIEGKITKNVCNVIITCTMYSNLIQQESIKGVPIIRVEHPLLEHTTTNPHQKHLIFSNPKTVAETVKKVEAFYKKKQLVPDFTISVIPDVFDLILTNQKAAYRQSLINYLTLHKETWSGDIYLMQLSMAIVSKKDLVPLTNSVFTILETLDRAINEELSKNLE
ncbi:hypothetical protein JZO78_11120 [Enterococcus ureilyticus]|uniref:hypothetical protein n=1 Tax=Enterococcus ureilyticus TaxID=1131292 RepID=UPI001A929A29|nr:hypothetical protein [Enterococcus ureilyticus]MBO0446897.1 hypothetical protein [Enterococcus ureilyticus]